MITIVFGIAGGSRVELVERWEYEIEELARRTVQDELRIRME